VVEPKTTKRNRDTIPADSPDIIEITPERKQARKRGFFDGRTDQSRMLPAKARKARHL
jgi:hypothetical protein